MMEIKKVNLALDVNVHAELVELTDKKGTTVTYFIRQCIKLGMMVNSFLEKNEGSELIMRKADGSEKKVIIL